MSGAVLYCYYCYKPPGRDSLPYVPRAHVVYCALYWTLNLKPLWYIAYRLSAANVESRLQSNYIYIYAKSQGNVMDIHNACDRPLIRTLQRVVTLTG